VCAIVYVWIVLLKKLEIACGYDNEQHMITIVKCYMVEFLTNVLKFLEPNSLKIIKIIKILELWKYNYKYNYEIPYCNMWLFEMTKHGSTQNVLMN